MVDKVATSNAEIARLKLTAKSESDPDEKAKLKESAKKKSEEKKIALERLPKYQAYFDGQGLWQIAEDIVDAVNESIIEPYNTRANVQKADAQIPELRVDDFKPAKPKPLKPDSPSDQPKGEEQPVPTPNPNDEDNPDNPNDNPEVSVQPVVHNEMDDYKSLSSVEKALVRKFLSVINSMTELPEKQKAKMKARLRKKIIK